MTETNFLTHKDRLQKFIKDHDEFSSEDSLHEYYLSLDDDENDHLIAFWSDILPAYQQQVVKSFKIKQSKVTKDFTIHGRFPSAIPHVLNKLLIKKEQVMDSSYYQEQQPEGESAGILYSIGSYLGSYVWGSPPEQQEQIPDDQEFINIQMVEKCASTIQRWADENKKTSVMEESKLRKTVRQILVKDGFVDVEDNIDLIFGHLRETGRLSNSTIQVGKVDVKIIKMAPIGQKFLNPDITDEEKAPFQLQELITHIEQKISQKEEKIPELNEQIKKLMKVNDKNSATKLLRQRKCLEKYIISLHNRKFHLDQVLLTIESGENTRLVFDSLQVATKASKALNEQIDSEGNRSSLTSDLESLLQELDQQQADQESINQTFADKVDEQAFTDQQLMDELEDLEKMEDAKTDKEQEDEIERRLRELQIPDDEIKVPQQEQKEKQLIGA